MHFLLKLILIDHVPSRYLDEKSCGSYLESFLIMQIYPKNGSNSRYGVLTNHDYQNCFALSYFYLGGLTLLKD